MIFPSGDYYVGDLCYVLPSKFLTWNALTTAYWRLYDPSAGSAPRMDGRNCLR